MPPQGSQNVTAETSLAPCSHPLQAPPAACLSSCTAQPGCWPAACWLAVPWPAASPPPPSHGRAQLSICPRSLCGTGTRPEAAKHKGPASCSGSRPASCTCSCLPCHSPQPPLRADQPCMYQPACPEPSILCPVAYFLSASHVPPFAVIDPWSEFTGGHKQHCPFMPLSCPPIFSRKSHCHTTTRRSCVIRSQVHLQTLVPTHLSPIVR